MRTLIVHQPSAIGHTVADIKSVIIAKNIAILRGEDFPTNTPFINIIDLIGDPNYSLSEHTCAMLHEEGILLREPVVDAQGRQRKLKDTNPLWTYTWADTSTASLAWVLSEEQLSELAWDLRHHRNFVHVSEMGESESIVEPLDKENFDQYDETDTNDDDDDDE